MQIHNEIQPLGEKKPTAKSHPCQITLKDFFKLLVGTALPIVIAVYTTVSNAQIQKSAELAADEQQRIAAERQAFDLERADKLHQQQLYRDLLDAMYTLDKDGKLNDSGYPWAFANARYRAAHREFDATRKSQALLFLKERQLIGRGNCTTGCEAKDVEDIIRLSGLSFDNLHLESQIGILKKLDLACIVFDDVSMMNATFSYVNLNGATFSNSRLNGVKFQSTSLNCTMFHGTKLNGADFANATLTGARFINADLTNATFTPSQQQEADFHNVIWPNGTITISETKTATTTITKANVSTNTSNTTTTTTVIPPNLLINSGAELGSTSGWKSATGSLVIIDSNGYFNGGYLPHNGTYCFAGGKGPNSPSELVQNVQLLDGVQGFTESQLDSGSLSVELEFYYQSVKPQFIAPDDVEVSLTFISSTSAVLSRETSGGIHCTVSKSQWCHFKKVFILPRATRSIDYMMIFIRKSTFGIGKNIDSYIDENSLKII